tara:strand:+ start:10821 stop:11786 length:966 start_codon:yes stop_codon:yes gene_type:complete
MKKNVYIAGHNGMVGSSIYKKLQDDSLINLITANRSKLDLTNQSAVSDYFKKNKIDEVYLAAAKVGGIKANNDCPSEFLYENLMIQNNIIKSSFTNKIKKLLFLGSSCIYPKFSSQPIKEEELLNGFLEKTNEAYAIAKIAGIKLCESFNRQYGTDYRSLMPTNLYGPGDNFHDKDSHVIPALIKRFHEAKINNLKTVVVWGTGKPKREFLHVNDLADAAIFLMELDKDLFWKNKNYSNSQINIGSGEDIEIKDLALMISRIVGYKGKVDFDSTLPDGTPRKLLDVTKAKKYGWKYKIDLEEGLKMTYEWYISNKNVARHQ